MQRKNLINSSLVTQLFNKYTIKILIASIIIVLFFNNSLFSQENEHIESEDIGKNRMGLVVELTYVPEAVSSDHSEADDGNNKGFFVPTIGLEYTRTLSHRWDIGLAAAIELKQYTIDDIDLNRHNPFKLVAFAMYRIVGSWFVFGGSGIEIEKHKNLAMFVLGTEYEFALGNGWDITPAFTFNHKEDLDTYALGVTVGKRF